MGVVVHQVMVHLGGTEKKEGTVHIGHHLTVPTYQRRHIFICFFGVGNMYCSHKLNPVVFLAWSFKCAFLINLVDFIKHKIKCRRP